MLSAAALFVTTANAAVNISTEPTQNMNCSGGVCTATAQKAYLNVTDLTNMLAAGDLKIVSGAGAEDIHIQAPFSWTSTSRLTLDAQRSVEFEKPVTIAGTGALTLLTNDGGSDGDYWFDEGASVSFWDTKSSLIINGVSFRLVRSLRQLSTHSIKQMDTPTALAANVDASADGQYTQSVIAVPLTSIYEGLGNTVSNLKISNTIKDGLQLGLFAYVSNSGTVRDLNVENAAIEGAMGSYIGILAAQNNGTVARCHSSGSVSAPGENAAGGLVGVSGQNNPSAAIILASSSAQVTLGGFQSYGNIGGLVGWNYGAISESISSGSVSDSDTGFPQAFAGGLVGYNEPTGSVEGSSSSSTVTLATGGWGGGLVGMSNGPITNSHATGKVSDGGEGIIGGLAASANTIVNSYATGAVTQAAFGESGGLAGFAGSIDSSFATGKVSAGTSNGSAGSLVAQLGATSVVKNSFATGPVSGDYKIGGLVGQKDKDARIFETYAIGPIQGGQYVGGVLGYDLCRRGCDPNQVRIRNSYWDLDTTGLNEPSQGVGNVPNASGVTGLTDAQLKAALPVGFDPEVWAQSPDINNGYPYLLANPPPKDAPGKARQKPSRRLTHRTPRA